MAISKEPHVVIVGAGLGGLQFIKKIAKHSKIKITVIDKINHHLFQPLLYQIATAVLSPADIAIPTRSLTTKWKNVSVMFAEVANIDKEKSILYIGQRILSYDYLILACGAETSYFGNDSWERYAPSLKTLVDALKIRKQILLSFEQAELAQTKEEVSELLTYIIIGGGPTGVELAGSIAELSHKIIRKDFRKIDPAMSEIFLIEAGKRLLSSFPEKLSEITKKQLEKRGVKVLLNEKVLNIDEKGVHLQDRKIFSHNIIWAAGVKGNSIGEKLNSTLDKSGRVYVNKFCQIPEMENIFIIGDLAYFEENGKSLPGVSPVAMQQGRYVAEQIIRLTKGKQLQEFHYIDKGNMATIGRKDAVANLGIFKFSGFVGWLSWLLLHLFYQVGFKNKVSILITWLWSYITFGAGARLIHEDASHIEKKI
ncbi:MAG: NAD(P)/FAD-dependent oxidoreductase [Leptospiraceae bacterium]|nr:NAD(P)/FAD-dependent oxidoreductase [Leptospiraceae bacterium]MCK6382322.1 NAD(P)/FAD-dependent oxidoreductase [Leptospiraceae bacterium]NUM40880.1 NAD(P)/FAD-dependent oxidoreductase [Leptospiraceae bacterium]